MTTTTDDTLIDVRAARFGATITSVVLGLAIILQEPVALWLLSWQLATFALSAAKGPRWSLYSTIFATFAHRLPAATATEPAGPLRFSQLCGAAVTTVALGLLATGLTGAATVAMAIVFSLSALQASVGICLGCELYLVSRRLGRTT